MFTLCLYLGFVSIYFDHCFTYENIALRKPAYQQYPYTGLPEYLMRASNAVDGLKSNLSVWGGQCVTSTNRKQTATWWVNLTRVLSIHHITIYYKTENVEWGPSNGYTPRFLGFSLYVSNTTNTSDGTLCFKDTVFNTGTIPAVFNATCLVHGQYVIYYNERLSGVIYPDGYSDYAFNGLSELEVFGCPAPGYYGSDCSVPCPDPHCRYCHIETGTCQGCKPGFQGDRCELVCNSAMYGDQCNETCGYCFEHTQCLHTNGTCVNGCAAGFRVCDVGYFGEQCSNKCGRCFQNEICHHISGNCSQGCLLGYQEPYCNEECIDGKYGLHCAEECGHCFDPLYCFHVNGSCLSGCREGFHGTLCKQVAVPLATSNVWKAGFFGLLGVLCACFILIGIRIALLRASKKRSPNICQTDKSRKETHKETEEKNENSGYQELSEFNRDLSTYDVVQ